MRKAIFSNKKYILSSGREMDLSAEHIRERIVISAMFNLLDPVQETGHSVLIRMENNQTVSFEEYMACGYGVCMSCVIKSGDKYVRTCIEGPVMRSNSVSF